MRPLKLFVLTVKNHLELNYHPDLQFINSKISLTEQSQFLMQRPVTVMTEDNTLLVTGGFMESPKKSHELKS